MFRRLGQAVIATAGLLLIVGCSGSGSNAGGGAVTPFGQPKPALTGLKAKLYGAWQLTAMINLKTKEKQVHEKPPKADPFNTSYDQDVAQLRFSTDRMEMLATDMIFPISLSQVSYKVENEKVIVFKTYKEFRAEVTEITENSMKLLAEGNQLLLKRVDPARDFFDKMRVQSVEQRLSVQAKGQPPLAVRMSGFAKDADGLVKVTGQRLLYCKYSSFGGTSSLAIRSWVPRIGKQQSFETDSTKSSLTVKIRNVNFDPSKKSETVRVHAGGGPVEFSVEQNSSENTTLMDCETVIERKGAWADVHVLCAKPVKPNAGVLSLDGEETAPAASNWMTSAEAHCLFDNRSFISQY